jgi:dTDP-4-amino-4,6-dideoxygalactose transaminase
MRGIGRTGPFLADVHANGPRGSFQVPIADSMKLKGKVSIFHPGLVNLYSCEVGETHPVLGYNYHMTDTQAAVDREQLRRISGIVARRGIMCSDREDGYKDSRHAPLPHSEACQDRTIMLPLYPQMTMADLEFVVSTLKKAIEPK